VHGYLLDTNILDYWRDSNSPEHGAVIRRLDSVDPDAPLTISAVAWGEIEYGHRCVSLSDTPIQAQFRRFLEERVPRVLDIRKTTAVYYGQLRKKLFGKFAPRGKKKGLRPEQLVDPLTAAKLGIQENDLWIAAQAMEHNLVLVTHDRMTRIREVVPDLLDIEDWTLSVK
jgi:tRNA(fMet)-specific endonuclease VapC